MATVVIHSRTKEKISCTYCMEWSEHKIERLQSGELILRSRLIDKAKAQSIIRRYGLVESHKTADGEVYDTPDGDLKKIFPDGIRSKDDLKTIEKVDNI